MKNTIFKITLLSALFAVGVVSAQPQPPRGGRQQKSMSVELTAQQSTDRMVKSLSLSEAQAKKVYDLNLKFAIKEAQEQKEVYAKQQARAKDMEKKRSEIESILTPEQKEKLAAKPQGKPHGAPQGKRADGKASAQKGPQRPSAPMNMKGRQPSQIAQGPQRPQGAPQGGRPQGAMNGRRSGRPSSQLTTPISLELYARQASDRLNERLKLSEAQVKKVYEVYLKYGLKAQEEQIAAYDAKQSQRKAVMIHKEQIEKVLTDEQKAKIAEKKSAAPHGRRPMAQGKRPMPQGKK